ncbi:MAG TPA: hypothetical protein VNF02_05195 [Candidatus Limnocylindrales bacterium]|nr:hypothetical protein [Candidatus Limnocylindrales bacterium]
MGSTQIDRVVLHKFHKRRACNRRVDCHGSIGRALWLFAVAGIFAMPAMAQQRQNTNAASSQRQADVSIRARAYGRPNFHERLHAYALGTFGPLKLSELAMGSAISDADNVPPEWRQGWGAYGQRFASDVGSAAIGGTTEFALGEAMHLDTRYYPCDCKGIWPRVRHALLSTITARAGEDGHRVFSIPSVAAPYASAFSTLAWYPSRYGPEDSFRTGNYNLLDSFGQNIALEFLLPVLHKFHLR